MEKQNNQLFDNNLRFAALHFFMTTHHFWRSTLLLGNMSPAEISWCLGLCRRATHDSIYEKWVDFFNLHNLTFVLCGLNAGCISFQILWQGCMHFFTVHSYCHPCCGLNRKVSLGFCFWQRALHFHHGNPSGPFFKWHKPENPNRPDSGFQPPLQSAPLLRRGNLKPGSVWQDQISIWHKECIQKYV